MFHYIFYTNLFVNVKLYVNIYLSFYKLLCFQLKIMLSFLRGLEVTELKEEDMPMVYAFGQVFLVRYFIQLMTINEVVEFLLCSHTFKNRCVPTTWNFNELPVLTR